MAAMSINSLKIQICETFESFDDKQRKDTFTLLKSNCECKCKNKCQCLTNLLFTDCDNKSLTYQSLRNIYNTINDIATRKNYDDSCNSSDNICLSMEQTCINDKTFKSSSQSYRSRSILFPLMQLPRDLIGSVAYYLNKHEIQAFELCCRRFYTIVNASSFVHQHAEFQELTIDCNILYKIVDYVRDHKTINWNLFKYSRCKVLILQIERDDNEMDPEVDFCNVCYNGHEIRNFQELIQSCDWFINLLKSVTEIRFMELSIWFLTELPTDLWLANDKYNLKKIYLQQVGFSLGRIYNIEFYVKLMKENNYNARSLECVEIYDINDDGDDGDEYTLENWFNMKHLSITGASIDCQYLISTRKYAPSLRKITFKSTADILFDADDLVKFKSNDDDDDIVQYKPLQIETLEMIDMNGWSHFQNILDNESIIRAINLHKSLTHVTFHIRENYLWRLSTQQWCNWFETTVKICIDRLLTKYYFHKLESINILFQDINTIMVDRVFDEILLNKARLLGYSSSLRQVFFGFKGNRQSRSAATGYVFSLCESGVLEKDLQRLKYHKDMCQKMLYGSKVHNNYNFKDGCQKFDQLIKL